MKQISWCPVVYDVSDEIQAAFERAERAIDAAQRQVHVTDARLTAALMNDAWSQLQAQGAIEVRPGARW